jgi:hypothetical protein
VASEPTASGTAEEIQGSNVMTEIVKKVALYLGADLVGIAPYDPRWVYTHRAYNPDIIQASSIKRRN